MQHMCRSQPEVNHKHCSSTAFHTIPAAPLFLSQGFSLNPELISLGYASQPGSQGLLSLSPQQ